MEQMLDVGIVPLLIRFLQGRRHGAVDGSQQKIKPDDRE
jgi:hypothetical protein